MLRKNNQFFKKVDINYLKLKFCKKPLKPSQYKTSITLGLFGTAGYLLYDFKYHPGNMDIPIKPKKILYPFDQINHIKIFNLDELEKRQLVVKNGLIYRSDQDNPLDGKWIYVMNVDNKIYIGEREKGINHTSLGRKLHILAAGEMTIKDGRLIELNENSGHYRPNNRVQLIEMELKKLDVILDSKYQCKNFHSRPWSIRLGRC